MDISKLVNSLKREIKDNASTILMGLGIAGVGVTIVATAKATPKAIESIDKAKAEKEFNNEPFRKIDYIKYGWKPFVPVAFSGAATIGCIVGENVISVKKFNALAAAYEITESALSSYKEEVKNVIGKNKENKVKDAVAQSFVDKNPPKQTEIIDTGKGKTLICDYESGRYFYSDMEYIKQAVNRFNHQLLSGELYLSLNDMYSEIGLDDIGLGELVGWNSDHLVEAYFPSCTFGPNRESSAIVLMFESEPSFLFRN